MLACIAVVGLVRVDDVSRNATVDQGDFMNSRQARTADAGNFAQIQDEIARRILIDLVRLIHYLNKIGGIHVSLKMHDGDRFACLLKSNSNFHILYHRPF